MLDHLVMTEQRDEPDDTRTCGDCGQPIVCLVCERRRVGRIGGQSRSARKVKAARENARNGAVRRRKRMDRDIAALFGD